MIPRVLLDVDGVLADFHTPCINLINKFGGTNHKVEDFDDWDIFNALKTPPDVKELVYAEMNKPGWCTEIGVYPGAIDGVRKIQDMADVYIVTSPMKGETWTRERDLWLMRHFDISTKRIIHTSAKHVCAGDMFIDDKIENLNNWRKCHPDGIAVRWMMAHLAHHKYDGPSTNDWGLIATLIASIKERQRIWTHG